MSRDLQANRGKGLEEAFFAKQNEVMRQQLRDTEQARRRKEALSAVCGVADNAILEELVALDFDGATLAALSLVH